jgi:alpha/beta superfamily hydrolase
MKFNTQDLQNEIEKSHVEQIKADHFYLSKVVENLKYYWGEDEGTELFVQTCRLAYMMYGIGETWQAVLLVSWAKQQAEESENYKEDENEFVMGVWGYN